MKTKNRNKYSNSKIKKKFYKKKNVKNNLKKSKKMKSKKAKKAKKDNSQLSIRQQNKYKQILNRFLLILK